MTKQIHQGKKKKEHKIREHNHKNQELGSENPKKKKCQINRQKSKKTNPPDEKKNEGKKREIIGKHINKNQNLGFQNPKYMQSKEEERAAAERKKKNQREMNIEQTNTK